MTRVRRGLYPCALRLGLQLLLQPELVPIVPPLDQLAVFDPCQTDTANSDGASCRRNSNVVTGVGHFRRPANHDLVTAAESVFHRDLDSGKCLLKALCKKPEFRRT